MAAVDSSELSVDLYQNTLCYIPDNNILYRNTSPRHTLNVDLIVYLACMLVPQGDQTVTYLKHYRDWHQIKVMKVSEVPRGKVARVDRYLYMCP
jgi:hypothetical protein